MGVLESQVKRPLRGRLLAPVLAFVAVTGGSPVGQSVLAPELKAAYLFNFARFVTWPADVMPTGAALVLCVADDGPVADALEPMIKGRTVEGHDLTVRRLKAGTIWPTCHVLYLGRVNREAALDGLRAVTTVGVFTVSAAAGFAEFGGIAELFLEGGRMRIAVNVDALQRAQVQLSSRVLGLAKIVKDSPTR